MYDKIDEFIASILHIPLSLFCRLTGRSNYFFAMAAMVCSFLISLLYYAIRLTIGKFDLTDGILWAFGSIYCIMLIILFRIEEQTIMSNSSTVNKSQFGENGWWFIRVVIGIANLIILFLKLLSSDKYIALSNLALVLWSIALYFAADTTPRGKGWLQQRVKSLTKAIKNLKVPSLNPAPPPITT